MLVKTGEGKLANLPVFGFCFAAAMIAWAVMDFNKTQEFHWYFMVMIPIFVVQMLWSIRFVSLQDGKLVARSLYSSHEFDPKTALSSWRSYGRGGYGLHLEADGERFQIGESFMKGPRDAGLALIEDTFGVRYHGDVPADEYIESGSSW